MGGRKPVVRDDGERYRSCADAARGLIRESPKVYKAKPGSMAVAIGSVCNGRKYFRSAYGHEWSWDEQG